LSNLSPQLPCKAAGTSRPDCLQRAAARAAKAYKEEAKIDGRTEAERQDLAERPVGTSAEAEDLRPRHGLQAQAAQVVKREVVL